MSIDLLQSLSGLALGIALLCQFFHNRITQKRLQQLEDKESK